MVDYQGYSGSTLATGTSSDLNKTMDRTNNLFDNTNYSTSHAAAPGYATHHHHHHHPGSPDTTNTPESLSEAATLNEYGSFPPGGNSMNYMPMMQHSFGYTQPTSLPRHHQTANDQYSPAGGLSLLDHQQQNDSSAHFDSLYQTNPSHYGGFSTNHVDNGGFVLDATPQPFSNLPPFMRLGPGGGLESHAIDDGNEIRGRAENWHYAETKQFVQILLAHRQELSDLRRHPGVWETVASELQACGYDRSVDKCKNRWKVLVAKYKKYTEKTLKGSKSHHHRLMSPAHHQNNLPKLPGFMQNLDGSYHPGLSINYQYYHSNRLTNPHGGTGGFEFYTEMHQLLSHIYSHGPDGVIKRRTPQVNPGSSTGGLGSGNSPPLSQQNPNDLLSAFHHPMDPNSAAPNNNANRSLYSFRSETSP